MSRSLSPRLMAKAGNRKHGPEGQGEQMFAEGKPCPPASPDHGKDHARRKGWLRAQQLSQSKKGKP